MTAPNFTFRSASTSRGLISSGEGSTEFYHPLLPTTLFEASGFLIVLNGWNLNRIQADVVGPAGTTASAIHMLQMRAPREPITPLLSQPGEGRIFCIGAKWRYRWEDSRTGEFSGLSPLPVEGLNVGEETIAGATTTIGQEAFFYLPTSTKPATADTIALYRNSSGQDNVWFRVAASALGSSSYILLRDNYTDLELAALPSVVTDSATSLATGPTWIEGVMPPQARAWPHPSGRVFYFGIRRFGKMGPLACRVAVTQGDDLLTIENVSGAQYLLEPGRVGQRVRFYSALTPTAINDPTVYRIVKVESSTTFRVYPDIQISAELASGATANWYWSIEDDRDSRWTWMSEPNQPWLIDHKKILATGDDFDDGVMAWFAVDNRVFCQTRRRIYEAVGSISDDPSRSTLFIPIADEGMPGFEAGCITPFGWVFFHEERGARLFDGRNCRPLAASAQTPAGEFPPSTQFANFEPAMAEFVRVDYDPLKRCVLISHAPLGAGSRTEVMVWFTTEKVWRGPYRERIAAGGVLRSSASGKSFVQGDDSGNLLVREAQNLDVTPTMTSFAGTGSITAITSKRIFIDAAANFTADGDDRARGSPIWFTDGAYYYFARVVDVFSQTELELDGPPVREDGVAAALTTGWTYGLGSIRWSLTTSYIDARGNPALPFEAFRLLTRFKRGAASESFEAAASSDGGTTFAGVRDSSSSSPIDTTNVSAKTHGVFNLKREGACVQIRVRGIARNGEPQVGQAVLDSEEREGALPE